MARIQPPRRRGLLVRFIQFFVRRRLGRVPTPWQLVGHHGRVTWAHALMEQSQEGARRVPRDLKLLCQVRTATLTGCPF